MDFRIALVTLFDFIIIAKNAVESLSDIADKRAKRIIIRKVFERRSRITFLKSVYLIATRDLSNLWLQFFLSQNQGFMRLFEKTVLK